MSGRVGAEVVFVHVHADFHVVEVGEDRRAGLVLVAVLAELVTVEDLAYTVYHQLGIDPDKKLMSPGNRPVIIVDEGKLRKECKGRSSVEI